MYTPLLLLAICLLLAAFGLLWRQKPGRRKHGHSWAQRLALTALGLVALAGLEHRHSGHSDSMAEPMSWLGFFSAHPIIGVLLVLGAVLLWFTTGVRSGRS